MKKRTALTALFLTVVTLGGLLAGCAGNGDADTTGTATTAGDPTAAPTEAPTETPTEPETPEVIPSGTIKILAIGNSFSTDCMQYLWQMLKESGYDEVILGNLYYGGCSLEQHLGFAKADSPSYSYHKNTTGTWNTVSNCKFSTALADEKWDIVTMQQTSKTCGLATSYGKTLTSLVDIVTSKVSPETKLIWNMTWAYQSDSTHSSFPNYDRDQMKMYNMIIDCMNSQIIPEKRFVSIIPAGTAIQNARTSFMGDHLTRDGYHMDYYIGRYIVGLCWYASLTGASLDRVNFNPSTEMITPDMMAAAKEAVANAIATPLAVTESKIKEGKMPEESKIDPTAVLDPHDFLEADTAVAKANGVDLSGYKLLEWNRLDNTYWNCTSKAGTTTPASTASTYHQNICSAKKYSITEMPVGTVIICDAGWQYRLEIFPSENAKYTGTRPGMTTAQFFTLTAEYLNGCTYLGWNIASSPKSDISAIYAQAAAHMRIYVPTK